MALVTLLAGAAAWVAGCDGDPGEPFDGGVNADSASPRPDTGPLPDGHTDLFAEVLISGCASSLITEPLQRCLGSSPLYLDFAALAPPDAHTFLWDFGDGSQPGSGPTPSHAYQRPGTYEVTLVVGGPFGTLAPSRQTEVQVSRAPLGSYCTMDGQCEGLQCLCDDGTAERCPVALQGTCTTACFDCGPSGICVDLSVDDATGVPAWRAPTCLSACAEDLPCDRGGFSCRELPVLEGGERGYGSACFPDVLGDVGDPCLDATRFDDPAGCASGFCLEIGRFGACSEPCGDMACPSHSACAVLTGGPRAGLPICLARCSPQHPCDLDPELACVQPDASGDLGFTLLDPTEPEGHAYCAPRRCGGALDCPSGLCDQSAGGFCL